MMSAFHGDPAVKDRYLARVRGHEAAREIVKGQGWIGGKGCLIGCTVEAYDPALYARELGVPLRVAMLLEVLFERLPDGDATTLPRRALEAMPVGADLSAVAYEAVDWIMRDGAFGVGLKVLEKGTFAEAVEVNRRRAAGEAAGDPESMRRLEYRGDAAVSAAYRYAMTFADGGDYRADAVVALGAARAVSRVIADDPDGAARYAVGCCDDPAAAARRATATLLDLLAAAPAA